VLSTDVSNGKHLQHHIYLEVLLRLKQYLSTTNYQPNDVIPALTPQVTTEQLFDTLLERYQSLYCLSLNIQLPFKSSEMNDYPTFIQYRLMRIPQLQQMIQSITGLLFMMTKIGLLPFVKRNEFGHRLFSERDLKYLEVIQCLKKSDVPVVP
jgi:hypothetical protein